MYRSYRLQPLTAHDGPLEFEWDPDSGQVRGPDAPRVRELAALAVKAKTVIGHPYPTGYEIHDPLRQVTELAVVLGCWWRLEGDLLQAYPAAPPVDGPVEVLGDGTEKPLGLQLLH